MKQACLILRLISLAFLFGGSTAVVFIAVTLIQAASIAGTPVADAATANAPIFINYSKVALGAAFALLLAEATGFAYSKGMSKQAWLRVASSILCIAFAIIFGLGLVPPMATLLPQIKTATASHILFTQLHETSRIVFGCMIFFALISLILSGLEEKPQKIT